MPLQIADEKQRLKGVKDMLHQYSAPAAEALIERRPDGAIQCFACGHRCVIKPGRDGVCRVRFNDDGVLRVPYGYVGALACDPIEKKPFFHVLPGSDALTFGMLGCDFHCGYCQNWVTSQMLRDPNAVAPPRRELHSNSSIWQSRTKRPSSHRATMSRSSPVNGRSTCSRKRRAAA